MAARVTVFSAAALAEALKLSTPQRVEIAHDVAGDAIDSAEVRTGEYRGGIGVEVDGDRVSVVDNDPEAFWKEYGTTDTPALAAVTSAARKYGKYSGYQPKR